MSGALALMMARARFNHLAAAGIAYIGANVVAGTTSGGATSAKVDLPAGSQLGDWVLITLNTVSSTVAGLSLTSPTAAQVLAPQNYTSTSGYQYLAAYLYQLTSGDITTGSLTVTTSEVSGQTVGLEVLRASGTLMLDVAGALGKGNIAASSTGNMTAPGVSAAAGAVVFYIAGLVTGGGGNLSFGSPPVGFNLDFNAYYQSSSPQALCHRPPTAAGATGDATMTATEQRITASDWGAVLLSLKQAVPAIVITYDFSDGTVGTAYTGSITATNVGGATGAITLTNDALPGGVSLGTRIDNGDGSYTWDVTGTPTTDTDTTPVTTDFGFDNGNGQTASYSQVWSIAAAASSGTAPSKVQASSTAIGTSLHVVFNTSGSNPWATPTAENLLYAVIGRGAGQTSSKPDSSWALLDSNSSPSPGDGEDVYWKVSDGTESTISFPVSNNASSGKIIEVTGQNATNPIDYHTITGANATATTVSFPAATPSVPNTLAIGSVAWNTTAGAPSASSGWDLVAGGTGSYSNSIYMATQTQGGAISLVSGSISVVSPGAKWVSSIAIIKP